MSEDFKGIVDWLREMGEIDGEPVETPAYLAEFGWTPVLIPLPRRAPDELF
jgi:hypothetical protein